MCPSCVSRNPGCFVPARVFRLGKRDPKEHGLLLVLDSRFRGNDTSWIPTFAGMTQGTRERHGAPSPSLAFGQPPLSRRGRGGRMQTGRLRYEKAPSPGLAFGQAGLSRQGRGKLLHSAKVF